MWNFSMQSYYWKISFFFREEDIVFDENLHFFGSKIKVATAVTQKVADQWLNYFKSPTHWTELWLNKALAIYIGTYRNLNLVIILHYSH